MSDETRTDLTADDFASEVSEQKQVRLDKRARMLDEGVAPYPLAVPITTTIAEIVDAHQGLEPDTQTGDVVGVAGRIVHLRNTGKLCFAALQSGDGARIQAMISLASVGDAQLAKWKEFVDLGDQVFVRGEVITSRRGELSIMADEWRMTSKALRPLPNLHSELNEETRVRQRYLDLITRPLAREMVRTRATTNASLRETFAKHGFLEVETPMLQTMHGGASARPFETHSNAFDTELFLRIAPELYLKRAAVGGIENVFEINRNFRNEGADSTHSPEFAMLEAYQSFGDYHSIADLTQELVQNAAAAVSKDGSHVVTWHDGTEFDLGGEWPRISMYESLSERGAVGALREGRGSTSRCSSSTSRSTPRRSPPRTARSPASSRSGISTCAASSSPRGTPSSSTPSCSASASCSRPPKAPAATTRRCRSTRSSCARSSTACPRPAAWAWASTGSSWRSPASASARRSSSRW